MRRELSKRLSSILCMFQIILILLILKQAILYFSSKDGLLVDNKIIGGDFITFYSAGSLFHKNYKELYDFDLQRQSLHRLFPMMDSLNYGELPFVYPPLVAYVFSKFSLVPYVQSFSMFALLSIVGSLSSLLVLNRYLNSKIGYCGLLFLLQLFSFLPYTVDTIIGGQLAWIGICIYAITSYLILRKNIFLAGMVFSLSYYKPPLFLIALLCFALIFGKKFIQGFLLGATIICVSSLAVAGIDSHVEYLNVVSQYTYGRSLYSGFSLPVSEGMGLYSLMSQIFGRIELCILGVSSMCFYLLHISFKFRHLINQDVDLKIVWISFVMVVSLGFSLQLIKYDLAILLVPFFLISSLYAKISQENAILLLLSIILFYLEFCFRRISLSTALIVNISMFNFIAIGIVLNRIFMERVNCITSNNE